MRVVSDYMLTTLLFTTQLSSWAAYLYTQLPISHLHLDAQASEIYHVQTGLHAFSPVSEIFRTSTTTFPVVKKEKVRGHPYFCDSPHSFASSTNSSIFTPKIHLYLFPSFHTYCCHLISNHQNLSPGCGDMFLLGLPISILASLLSIFLQARVVILKTHPSLAMPVQTF